MQGFLNYIFLIQAKKNYILLSDVLIIKEKQKSFQLSWYELIAVANSGVILHLHKVEDGKNLKIKVVRRRNFFVLNTMEIGKVGTLTCPQPIASLLGLRSHRSDK